MKAFGKRLAIIGTVASVAVGGTFAVIGAASADEAQNAQDCVNSICTVTIQAKQAGAYVSNDCLWNDTGNFGQCLGNKGASQKTFSMSVEYHEGDSLSFTAHVEGAQDQKFSTNGSFLSQNGYCASAGLAIGVIADCRAYDWS
jgi:hypothetical protein